MLTTPVAGNHMVQRRMARRLSAILAKIAIPTKDLPSRQPYLRQSPPHKGVQADHRRALEGKRYGVNLEMILGEHLGLAANDKDQGPPDVANVQGFKVLVEYENLVHREIRLLLRRLRRRPYSSMK
jgi:hypothetical protein